MLLYSFFIQTKRSHVHHRSSDLAPSYSQFIYIYDHPASYVMGTENSFPGVVLEVKLLCREGDHLLDLEPMLKFIGSIASLLQMLSRP
jgi:hypothetical protein